MFRHALRIGLATFACATLAPVAAAQNPGPGLVWLSTSGAFAGGFVPTCVVQPVDFSGGEQVALTVWGDHQKPYILLVAFGTAPCAPFPPFGGELALDSTLLLVRAGTTSDVSPCLACPDAFETTPFTVPVGFPAGITFVFQALAVGASQSVFTVPIAATSV